MCHSQSFVTETAGLKHDSVVLHNSVLRGEQHASATASWTEKYKSFPHGHVVLTRARIPCVLRAFYPYNSMSVSFKSVPPNQP